MAIVARVSDVDCVKVPRTFGPYVADCGPARRAAASGAMACPLVSESLHTHELAREQASVPTSIRYSP